MSQGKRRYCSAVNTAIERDGSVSSAPAAIVWLQPVGSAVLARMRHTPVTAGNVNGTSATDVWMVGADDGHARRGIATRGLEHRRVLDGGGHDVTATIGRRTGVAMIFGCKFAGLIAWGMWRNIYLMKLPRLAKKLRVMMDWTLHLLFGREIEQMITLHDVQALSDRLARIRAQTKRRSEEQTSLATNVRSS